MTKNDIPAFERQDEIKAKKEEIKINKYLIDLEDKNIPAYTRQQIRKELDSNVELRAKVFEMKYENMKKENVKLMSEIARLQKELGC